MTTNNSTKREVPSMTVQRKLTVPVISSKSKVQDEGSVIYDPTTNNLYSSNGSAWISAGGSAYQMSAIKSEVLTTGVVGGTWTTVLSSTHWDQSTGIYTTPEDGIYKIEVSGYSLLTNGGDPSSIAGSINIDGSASFTNFVILNDSANDMRMSISANTYLQLNESQQITINIATANTTGSTTLQLSIAKVG